MRVAFWFVVMLASVALIGEFGLRDTVRLSLILVVGFLCAKAAG